jgi:hypothetical protein
LQRPQPLQPGEPVGERILVDGVDQTFPAGEPFHIMHGYFVFSAEGPVSSYGFDLEVDGEYQDYDFFIYTGFKEYPVIGRWWVYNFPDGMTGTHTFSGHWMAPCKVAIEYGYEGPCETPYEKVEWNFQEITVTFVEE